MELIEQQARVRRGWQELLEELRGAGIRDQVLLGTLSAELSRLIAEQLPASTDSWFGEMRSQVARLREQQTLQPVTVGETAQGDDVR